MLLALRRTSGLPGFDALVARQRVGDEVDLVVARPTSASSGCSARQAAAACRCFACEVGHPEIGGVAAAVVLARPDGGVAVEDERLPVGREAAPEAPVDRQRLFHAAARPAPRTASPRSGRRRRRARRGRSRYCRIARPADDLVVAGVVREPPGRTAVGRNDEHVVVAVAVGGEGDPPAIGRKAGIDLARRDCR